MLNVFKFSKNEVNGTTLISQQTNTCPKSTIKTLEKDAELCLKLTINTPERYQLRRSRHSGIFIVNFGHSSHLFLVFPFLALNR